jgi:hypothetical protein
MKRTDFTGQRFGRLVALEFVESRCTAGTNHTTYWRFLCDCGVEVVRSPFSIRQAKFPSCPDCIAGSFSWHWKGAGDISADLFHGIRMSAKARNLSFELTITEMWSLFLAQGGKCALSGWGIEFSPRGGTQKRKRTASLDRIDSARGYICENVQWVHRDINKMKSNKAESELFALCRDIADHTRQDSQHG